MSNCSLGYIKQASTAEKIDAIENWATKWNATKQEFKFRNVTLEDRNFSEGLISTQEEQEEYLSKPRKYQTMVEYTVTNASKECWREERQIMRMN